MHQSQVVTLSDSSRVMEARRSVASVASELGFGDVDAGKAALLVTEAATNVIKHAGQGEVLVRPVFVAGHCAVEMLVLDRGPGIHHRCFSDGYSTAGSAGTGLGALQRLATRLDVYSAPDTGTALLLQLCKPGPVSRFAAPEAFDFGVVCVPKPGEVSCGDAWFAAGAADGAFVAVADGLGHGPGAAHAAREAIAVIERNQSLDPRELLEAVHIALRGTRGAAMAVASINIVERQVTFCGVGNIDGTVAGPRGTRKMVSSHGTLGHQVHKIVTFTYPWPDDSVLVLHSDGLGMHWNLDAYPGLRAEHPSVIAGVLYRDFSRRRDDVTVLVAKPLERAA